jgi:hypothetical protein
MSVAVTGTGDPAARGGPPGRAGPARWRSRLTFGTTPGRLRLALIGLVAASLAWGALATFTVSQYSSAATSVVTTSEPLTLDAQQIYHDLSDANDTEATAFLVGGMQPQNLVDRYSADVRAASAAIERATALGGGSPDLTALSAGLPAYVDEIGTGRADSRLGYPLGSAYMREASNQMNASLLPAAQRLYNADNAKLTATSAQGTGLPLMLVTIVAGLALGYALYWMSRWLAWRTNRVLNPGLIAAGLAGLISLVWLAVAFGGAYFDLQGAQTRGSIPVQALAHADIVALQAHADESLTLIDNSGDDQYQSDFLARREALGPGRGTLFAAAISASAGTPGAAAVNAAAGRSASWGTAHAKLRVADDDGDHATAVKSALGYLGSQDAGHEFDAFSADMTTAIDDDQAAFAASASAGGTMYAGLEAAMIVLALTMAAASAWGLNRRLMEYR